MKYQLKKGQTYLCCVWSSGPFRVTQTKGFKTIEGARRWTKRKLEDPTVYEVSILVKKKRVQGFPWFTVERTPNPSIEQMKAARARVAAEERERKRR